MTRKTQSTRSSTALVASSVAEVPTASLHRRRSAVDVSEDADARLTGMTRSLDRRLLALNLQPMRPGNEFGYMKVA